MPKPFDTLCDRLLRAGIAPRHARRYLAELTEHLADLTEMERRNGAPPERAAALALAKLGSEDTLAAAMISRPELRAWSVRAPWAAYLLAPSAAFGAGLALAVFLIFAVVELYRPAGGGRPILPPWFGGLTAADTIYATVLLPLLLGWGLAWQAARQRMQPFWPVLGLAAIAVIGGSVEFAAVLPVAPDQHGELSLGFALAPPFADLTHTAGRIALNLALTLLPYLIWQRRERAASGAPALSAGRLLAN
jgi:hypothetical protein